MFIISNLILAIAKIIDLAITLYIFVIIARVVLSWIPHDPYNSLIRFVYNTTDPVLSKIRNIIPPFGGLDLSPMILILCLYIIESFIVSTLRDLALALK